MLSRNDIRYALRALIRNPAFLIAALCTLTVGSSATIGIFAVVDSVLFQPLPYNKPSQLFAITYETADGKSLPNGVPGPAVTEWVKRSHSFEAFAEYTDPVNTTWLTTRREQIPVTAAAISVNFLSVLGIRNPTIGRTFPIETTPFKRSSPVLVSDSFWQTKLGKNLEAVGMPLILNGRSYEVIGVVPEELQFPTTQSPDVFFLLRPPASKDSILFANVIGRMKVPISVDEAQKELSRIVERSEGEVSAPMRSLIAQGAHPRVQPLKRYLTGDLRSTLLLVFFGVGLLAMLGCTNVAALLLARMNTRSRELAVHAALGATTCRLSWFVLLESICLTVLSTGLSLLLVSLCLGIIRYELASLIPSFEKISIGINALLFLFLTTAVTIFFLGGIGIFTLRKLNIAKAIRQRGLSFRRSPHLAMRTGVIAIQSAISILLLITALLLVSSFQRASSMGLGFQPENVLTFKIPATVLGNNPKVSIARLTEILNLLRGVADVVDVGASSAFPLSGHNFGFDISIGDERTQRVGSPTAAVDMATQGYFRALGIDLKAGRFFDAGDSEDTPAVAIVNTTFVHTFLSDANPIGRKLSLGGTPEEANISIVGVVSDVREGPPGASVPPKVYRPLTQPAQLGWNTAAIVVRTDIDPIMMGDVIRRRILELGTNITMYEFMPMETRLSRSVMPHRQRALFFTVFSVMALILMSVGIYGVITYSVTQDMHEFGIRLALGSRRVDLWLHVIWRATWPACVGMAGGVLGCLALNRIISAFLYGISATSVIPYLLGTVLMLAVTFLAAAAPAYRAISSDPTVTLRGNP